MKKKLMMKIFRGFFLTILLCMFLLCMLKNGMYSLVSDFDLDTIRAWLIPFASCMDMDDVGASSQSSVNPAPPEAPKTALQQREDELILENVEKRKGALGEGQQVSEVRSAVEKDLRVQDSKDRFNFIQTLEAETKGQKSSPAINCVFNEISDFQSGVQDGLGGGKGETPGGKGETPGGEGETPGGEGETPEGKGKTPEEEDQKKGSTR